MVFVIDWNGADNADPADDLNLNGTNTLTNGVGDTAVINVSTPVNTGNPPPAPITQWHLSTAASNIGDADGELVTGTVWTSPAVTTVTAPGGMTGLTFELYDIDQDLTAGTPWSDLVRVYALDAAGNPLPTPINITNTNVTHTVTSDGTTTTIAATGAADPNVNGSGAADTVTVTIPGTVYGVVIEYSTGNPAFYSGVVGIGPMTFSSALLPCFMRGTMIETDRGEVAVEDLQPGDMVRTLDKGFKPLRWVGAARASGKGQNAPVRFAKGTIGNHRDLLVSPAHRVMVQDWQADLLFGAPELLAAAHTLVNGSTITREEVDEVEYFHILFDGHEIVFSNGAPTESFHPGEADIGAMAPEARDEIYRLFPELAQGNGSSFGPAARATLRPHEAALLSI